LTRFWGDTVTSSESTQNKNRKVVRGQKNTTKNADHRSIKTHGTRRKKKKDKVPRTTLEPRTTTLFGKERGGGPHKNPGGGTVNTWNLEILETTRRGGGKKEGRKVNGGEKKDRCSGAPDRRKEKV